MSHIAFLSWFIILEVGSPVPSLTFQTLSLRCKNHLFMTLVLTNSPFHCWMILWVVTGMSICSAPSERSRSIWPELSSIILVSLASLFPCTRRRRGYPETPSLSGSDQSSTMLMLQLLLRNSEIFGSRPMKSGRSLLHYSSGGTAQSIRC